ncbi:unnamed protein product [Vitrella brassicaformis CCMP3155]|uniref:WD40 repeat-containing protein SMU1 n=1 Tax=Vitrella brassicaformis (strain CCMP3155) TaxID=1169540 RepID=A0A0G4FIJ1_VITBC|nr:unnamed protein product [Vitrella brassicaformis CCMP3155]|mmetsp:Transcript_12666/g.30221  ORF Transcript_12666/g.30221 Transcript_12666/m.30221 type:complete len:518 (-) Transcript_12666:542-2095(-)|eukprot:CEM13105.1 unnamed protein product [Vitrella brassicaformis CCMP3155]
MGERLEIDSSDVIRLILQFLKENSLHRTFQTLQEESRVAYNTVESVDQFLADVNQGKWGEVLQTAAGMNLPEEVLQNLYEHIVCEMLEAKEPEVARQLLRETAALQSLKLTHPDRFKKLDHLCNKGHVDSKEAYEGMTVEKRRAALGQDMVQNLQAAPPSRLLAIIGQAMKWQNHQGLLPPGMKFDLFRGMAATAKEEAEECASDIAKTIIFPTRSYPECAAFSPDGQHLVTGSVDGIVEVWDYLTGKLRTDLSYQAEDAFMVHDTAVVSLAFTRDAELLASGDQDGNLKVWKISTGKCLKKYTKIHQGGITSIVFSKDSSQLLTASFDNTARLHGLKSGKTLKEFRGHTSYVNCAIFTGDGTKIVTGSSDGRVKVWDAKTTDCLQTFAPPPPSHLNTENASPQINAVFLAPKSQDLIYVCTRAPTLHLMNLTGQVLKTLSSGKKEGGDFVCAAASRKGEWLYCCGEDNTLYCFSNSTGKLEHLAKVHEKDVIGLIAHPLHNLVATWGIDGKLHVLK